MKTCRKKIIAILTCVVTMLVCSVTVFATDPSPSPTPTPIFSDTLSEETTLTLTNTRDVSVPTNASYPVYMFVALAGLSAVILFVTIKQRRATHD